jgi:putative membrane protein
MIVRRRPNPIHLFLVMQGSILLRIIPQILFVFCFSFFVVWIERCYPAVFHNFTAAPFTLLGTAISIFLAFRNNACYDRWWEARRMWGQLILEMRSFARLVTTLLPGSPAAVAIVRNAIAFTYALNGHLRKKPLPAEVAGYLAPADLAGVSQSPNPPDAILRIISRDLAAELKQTHITDILYKAIDEHVAAMTAIQSACERITSTPVPFSYTLLLHRSSSLFCLLLPFGLANTFGDATPIFAALIAYCFFGLDALADELEAPFDASANELPLNAISRLIEISLLESIGETNLPRALEPVDYILT